MRSRLKQPRDTRSAILRAESFDKRLLEERGGERVNAAQGTGAHARGAGGHSYSARRSPEGLLAGVALSDDEYPIKAFGLDRSSPTALRRRWRAVP